jgi:hypothetical protein
MKSEDVCGICVTMIIISIVILIAIGITSYHKTRREFIKNGYIQSMDVGCATPIWVKNEKD